MITLDTNLAANNATTQYLNFTYNSMVRFGDRFLCASDSGLFEMTGNTDDGTNINSYFELMTMDFGSSNQKRLRAVYLGYEAVGDITLVVSTEMGTSESYTVPATTSGQHARRIMISRAIKGRYWTFKVQGDSVSFCIDEIRVLPIFRSHGFDRN